MICKKRKIKEAKGTNAHEYVEQGKVDKKRRGNGGTGNDTWSIIL
jgi:hypothetical protein